MLEMTMMFICFCFFFEIAQVQHFLNNEFTSNNLQTILKEDLFLSKGWFGTRLALDD